MSSIRLAHLSDIHLPGPLPSGRDWLSKRGLSGLSWAIKRHKRHRQAVIDRLTEDLVAATLDAIAITGDLVNFGLEAEYAAARTWLEMLGEPERVVAIPGNHDAMMPGWEQSLERHWSGFASAAPSYRQHGPVALIAVSTAIPTLPFFASGRMFAAHIAEMERLTGEAHRNGLCPIVLMHHPPTDITAWRKALHGRKAVAEALVKAGAALVLHGHNHRRDLSVIDPSGAAIPVLGVPSFSVTPGYHHIPGAWREICVSEVEDGWSANVIERRIDGQGDVVPATPIVFALPRRSACRSPVNR